MIIFSPIISLVGVNCKQICYSVSYMLTVFSSVGKLKWAMVTLSFILYIQVHLCTNMYSLFLSFIHTYKMVTGFPTISRIQGNLSCRSFGSPHSFTNPSFEPMCHGNNRPSFKAKELVKIILQQSYHVQK